MFFFNNYIFLDNLVSQVINHANKKHQDKNTFFVKVKIFEKLVLM